MQLIIKYDSKWSLGTLDEEANLLLNSMGSISEGERKDKKSFLKISNSYRENLRELGEKYPNFKYNEISHNTVVGILYRLVGDVRRLSDIRFSQDNPITQLEDKVSFINSPDSFQNEIMTLHKPETDVQNNAGGLITKDSLLIKDNVLTRCLYSIFELSNEEILMLSIDLKNNAFDVMNYLYKGDISVIALVKHLINGELRFKDDKETLEQIKTILGNNKIYNIYGILLYEMLEYMDRNTLFPQERLGFLNQNGNIAGIAKTSGGLTLKDFYSLFVKDKKKSWTMPYMISLKSDSFENYKEMNFKSSLGVTKECGTLLINIDVDSHKATYIQSLINEAKVGPFYMGKKGLAYVEGVII